MRIPRLIFAGTNSGSGKTSVTAAVIAAFSKRGMSVCPYKAGPDYIDPAFHTATAKIPCRNLDSWLVDENIVRYAFCDSFTCSGGDIAVIEGVMGLFDGQGSGHEGSTAHLAEILRAPIILVVNVKGMSRSLAALIHGFAGFMPETKIAGVILNRVKGQSQYAFLKEIIEKETDIPCFGFLPEDSSFHLESRHLGLVQAGETPHLDEYLQALSTAAEEYIDLGGLLAQAESAGEFFVEEVEEERKALLGVNNEPPFSGVRIGLARDKAFAFYYQDNLDLLEKLGVELVPFSPMNDCKLPDNLHGLYLGGGYPEVFAVELEQNESMRRDVREKLASGLPCFAECGGFIYLLRGITTRKGNYCKLSGFFPFDVEMTNKLQNFGYAEAVLERDTVIGKAGLAFRMHEFHYSIVKDESGPVGEFPPVCRAGKPSGKIWKGGLQAENTLGMYPHLHFYSQPETAYNFVRACYEHRKDNF